MQNRSASVVSSDSDGTCFTFCCSPCLGLRYLLCLGSMRVTTRMKVVWIWMISLSLFGGLYIRYNLYGTDTASITSYDMMPVRKMSTFFCRGVRIQTGSNHTLLMVYRLNNKPRINYTRTMYTMSDRFTNYFIQVKMVNFYLLQGSSVTVSICAEYAFTIDIVQGTKNYEDLKFLRDGPQKTLRFPSICSVKTFDVTVTDRYYFILNNMHTLSRKLKFVLHKTTFELDKSVIEEQSFVPLTLNSDESIVYQPILENYQELIVTSSCCPSILIYNGIFFGGSVTLGFILCYLVKCMCKDPMPEPPQLHTDPAEYASPNYLSIAQPFPHFHMHPTAPPAPSSENHWPSRTPQFPSCPPPPSYDSLFANSANNAPPS